MSLQLTNLVERPATGNSGRRIRVRANFFEITAFANTDIHHYDFTISPMDCKAALVRKIWQTFEDTDGQGILTDIKAIFDGRRNVFSPKPLPLGERQAGSFEVELHGQRRRQTYKIHLKKVSTVNMEDLCNFLIGQAPCTSNVLTAIMVLNILLHNIPSSIYVNVGRSFYTPYDKRVLSHGAEIWRGYFQSARPTPVKMMVNINVDATAFHESGPLPQIVANILNCSLDELEHGISHYEMFKLETILKAICIHITLRDDQKRVHKITGITPTPASRTVFKDEAGNEITITDYFLRQYNKRLRYPFLPCVIVHRNTFYPMEVCEVVPGQRMLTKLNKQHTTEMLQFARHTPNIRTNRIKEGFNLLKYKDNPYMQQFGVSIEPELAIINARVLPTPKIAYNPSSANEHVEFAPQAGAWNMKRTQVAHGTNLKSWSVVNFAGSIPRPAIEKFIRELCQIFVETGMNVIRAKPPIISADPHGDIERTLKEAWLKAGNAASADPQLIVCILPNTGLPLYAEIKRVCDTVIGIPSQCVQSKHIAEAKEQYCANLCLKVNAKLGGSNHYLTPPDIPFIIERPTIVLGAALTHPVGPYINRPSTAALAASVDTRASRYLSTVRVQRGRTEIISNLANMVKEALDNFHVTCGQWPERILFYRAGISESQFKQVVEVEVAGIRAACASLDENYKPTLTFIVAHKRHHARFFPMEPRNADTNGNCMPGIVIDTDIVHPFEFDFYLQSHAGIQGTSRPVHYHVLHDDNNFTSNALHELTYNLCYCYARTTRSVSIVPAVYYAHLVARRARYHLRSKGWTDNNSSFETTTVDATQMVTFNVVKPGLRKVMYFI